MVNRIGIILWLYDQSLCDEFVSLLYPIKEYAKIYLQLCSENDSGLAIKKFSDYGLNHSVSWHPNCGMDVLPFLNIIPEISEPYFIKLHGKRSFLRPHKHINWRALLVNSLIGSRTTLLHNTIRLINDSNIGMIGNEHLIMDNIGTNLDKIKELVKILDINENTIGSGFIGGNMFMSRTKLFQKYFTDKKLSIIKNLLSTSSGKLDDSSNGTYAHSLERIFGYIVSSEGLHISPSYHSIIRIQNKNQTDKFNIIRMYNNDCYLLDDLVQYGAIVNENDKTITISWADGKTTYNKYL